MHKDIINEFYRFGGVPADNSTIYAVVVFLLFLLVFNVVMIIRGRR